jgi:outer membrane immunogenic protein
MQNPGQLPLLGATQGSVPISGGFFGGQLGGNWQVEWAVFGIQADAHWADIEGHGSCFDAGAVATAGISFACNDKVSSFGTVTGRVGAAVDRALIYAKGGWAWEYGQHSTNPTAPFNVMGGNNGQASITADSSTQWRTGWTFGAGVEYAFVQNWSAFVEYNFIDFGTKAVNSTQQRSSQFCSSDTGDRHRADQCRQGGRELQVRLVEHSARRTIVAQGRVCRTGIR